MYFFNQGEDVYHIIADVNTGVALCGAKMSGLEQWRRAAGKATRRVSNGEPVSLRLCKQCENSLSDSPPTDG
jgi:hypothetical protein